MTTDWKDLPTITDVGKAQADEWEIQRLNSIKPDLWVDWDRYSWSSTWTFRGRPRQPKMRKLKLLCWFNGSLNWYAADEVLPSDDWIRDWIRVPSEDKEIEIPDEN